MPPRNYATHHEIPAGAIFIDFPRSDGDISRRPLDPTPPRDGTVNFHVEFAPGEPIVTRWRVEVAKALAQHVPSLDPDLTYCLSGFPEGYTFWDHHKGPKNGPRRDPYLFGSSTVLKFRSVNEFVPHAIWLFSDPSAQCACKYCSGKKTQTQVSEEHGLKTIRGGGGSGPSTVRRIVQPARQSTVAPKQRTAAERNSDLRASAFLRRRFRVGEVVWCQLNPPIFGHTADALIRFWPSIIQESRLKTRAGAHGPGEDYVVEQLTLYKVKLLGVLHAYVLPERDVLPYLGYLVPLEFMDMLRNQPPPALLSQDLAELSDFMPMPEMLLNADTHVPSSNGYAESPRFTGPVQFLDAAAPYALALQIAAYVTNYWALTDEWQFKYPTQPTSIAPPSSAEGVAGPSIVPDGAALATERRYQGLWWGTERLWMDELVRIRPGRDVLAPQGSDQLFAPSDGAETRGCFIYITCITIEEGARPTCKVAGPIFELAPEGWADQGSPSKLANGEAVSAPYGSSSRALVIQAPTTGLSSPVSTLDSTAQQYILPPVPQTSYPLPPPPAGFVFRPIVPAGYEMALDAHMLAGRYYPALLDTEPLRSLMQPDLASLAARKQADPEEADTDDLRMRLVRMSSLCGLASGCLHSMECYKWKLGRKTMLTDADAEARQALYKFWTGLPDGDTGNVGPDGLVAGDSFAGHLDPMLIDDPHANG